MPTPTAASLATSLSGNRLRSNRVLIFSVSGGQRDPEATSRELPHIGKDSLDHEPVICACEVP